MKVIDLHAHVHRDYERKIYLVEEQLEDMEKNKITLRMISALQGKSIHDQNHFILNFFLNNSDYLKKARKYGQITG